jgi:hypothetical protein
MSSIAGLDKRKVSLIRTLAHPASKPTRCTDYSVPAPIQGVLVYIRTY